MSISSPPMIRWNLRQVMSDRKVTNRDLALRIKVHETNVSKMKRRDDMPRIDGVMLNALCNELNCTPSDLIVYTRDEGGDDA